MPTITLTSSALVIATIDLVAMPPVVRLVEVEGGTIALTLGTEDAAARFTGSLLTVHQAIIAADAELSRIRSRR